MIKNKKLINKINLQENICFVFTKKKILKIFVINYKTEKLLLNNFLRNKLIIIVLKYYLLF